MSKPKHSNDENPDNNRRREAFERNSAQVMAGLGSPHAKRRSAEDFGESLTALNASLFALAYCFLRSEPNPSHRRDLAEEARQIWHVKMLAGGFQSYLTKGKRSGKPFGPYARTALYHICVDILRGRDRICTLATLDGFSDPRRDPRAAAEHRELERTCRELMETLPSKWQEVLRAIYCEGLSGIEISDRLGTNPQSVANWHLRSRKRLGDEFRRRGYWPP